MADTGSVGAEPTERFAGRIVTVLLALAVAIAIVGRFFVTSPLWLDEALSVNISKLPLGDIAGALKHDGHPPLYYFILHGWMDLFGDGDHAVRALSGLITIATLPLAYLTGRRIGGKRLGQTTVLMFVLSPYVFRYGSETRMYALLMAEVFAGYLLVTSGIDRPRLRTFAGVAAVTGLLLWTHYWSMWLIAAIGLLTVVRMVRARRRDDRDATTASLKLLAALVVGCVTFVPWLPTLAYQSQHTGTPWAPPFRLATLLVTSITEFAGGPYSEAQVGMLLLAVLLVIGIFGTGLDNRRVELDFYAHPLARRPLSVLVVTIVIAFAVGTVNGMAFAPRYAAVFFPLVVILLALGVDQFRGGAVRDVVLALVVLTALAGMTFVVRIDRTEAGVAATAIEKASPTGIVITCPDQLGPSVARVLDRDRFDVSTYPRFGAPERVDWVDYKERNTRNDPSAFGAELLARAGDQPIYVVISDQYLTLEGQCQRVIETLANQRPARTIVLASTEDYYESMAVVQFDPKPA